MLVGVVYISPCRVGTCELSRVSIQLRSELGQNCSSLVLVGSELVRGAHNWFEYGQGWSGVVGLGLRRVGASQEWSRYKWVVSKLKSVGRIRYG